ncbi:DNA polymerase alpha catalytic subunit-like isoform X2 [Zophobas morio]|uniref:DNA polymerase alpha catalytic subunit-like isoform X2 n=1 Tax=Zophobas morio TaxID=2755281 RepID=UPI003083DC12
MLGDDGLNIDKIKTEHHRPSRRTGAMSKHKERNQALNILKEAKVAKAKGVSFTQLEVEGDIWEYIDEDEQVNRVNSLRKVDFLVDYGVNDLGYADDGREWWDDESSGAESDFKNYDTSPKKRKASEPPGGPSSSKTPSQKGKLNFLKLQKKIVKSTKASKKVVTEEDARFLSSLLSNLQADEDLPHKRKITDSHDVDDENFKEPPQSALNAATPRALERSENETVSVRVTEQVACATESELVTIPDEEFSEVKTLPPAARRPLEAAAQSKNPLLSLPYAPEPGERTMNFYWLDLFEDANDPGTVYLFGKVYSDEINTFVSCTVVVQNVSRNLFFLPRPTVLNTEGVEQTTPFEALYEEVEALMDRHGIKKWKCKKVTRYYAFELSHVPTTAEYLKCLYPYTCPPISESVGKTFSRVFGTRTSAAETFILKRKLMGPCWLEVRNSNPATRRVTWSKLEFAVADPKDVVVSKHKRDPPFFKLAALSLKTILNPNNGKHEIVLASLFCHARVSIDGPTSMDQRQISRYSVVRHVDGPLPYDFGKNCEGLSVEQVQGERYLLNLLMAKLHKYDPDILAGHNLFGFEVDVLLHRMRELRVTSWSKIGRFRRRVLPRLSGNGSYGGHKLAIAGRLGLSTYLACKEFLKVKSYSLSDLAEKQLAIKRTEWKLSAIPPAFESTKSLLSLITHNENDGYIVALLAFSLYAIPLTKQITNISGNVWSRTLAGGRAERNEYLLLHEFHNRKFIVPDKHFSTADDEKYATSKKKSTYLGGLVLDPKKGFYDSYVVLMDFNSLYPSIIQEYNLCFTTVDRPFLNEFANSREWEASTEVELPSADLERGVLPKLLEFLVARRKEVKLMMRNCNSPQDLAQLDIRQLALKLTANSMYGCLGFAHSRFYAKPIAELITKKGREILQSTAELVQNQLCLEVIYGDTDSVMINTRASSLDEVKKIGERVRWTVNMSYKLLELEVDAIYKKMLLLKKKKYAALALYEDPQGVITTRKEVKGLDIVRRDWSELAVEVGGKILDLILSDRAREVVVSEILDYLRTVANDIRDGKVCRDKFIITKALAKPAQDYPDKKSQPHVQVALRMESRGLVIGSRDTIPYIICASGSTEPGNQLDIHSPTAMRAFHPDELGGDHSLVVDIHYYLKQQIYPVVSRLTDPIDEISDYMIAESLGIESPGHFSKKFISEEELDEEKFRVSEGQRFEKAAPLLVRCGKCQREQQMAVVARRELSGELSPALLCEDPACRHPFPLGYLKARLKLDIEKWTDQYYQGWATCDDLGCSRRVRLPSTLRCTAGGCCGGAYRQDYTSADLYNQLLYYKLLFDMKKFLKRKTEERRKNTTPNKEPSLDVYQDLVGPHQEAYQEISQYIHVILTTKNARGWVDLAEIMKVFRRPRKF